MGNSLNKPITKKETEVSSEYNDCDSNESSGADIRWAVSSMQGWRVHMEDAHVAKEFSTIDDPTSEDGGTIDLTKTHHLFAILDGHGGTFAAEYASQNLFGILTSQSSFVEYAHSIRKADQQEADIELQRCLLTDALENAFVLLDLQLLQEMARRNLFIVPPSPQIPLVSAISVVGENEEDWGIELCNPEIEPIQNNTEESSVAHYASGTTITLVLVTPKLIMCANVGDSRTILDSYPLSKDHTPSLQQETDRIVAAGGHVNFGRVDGELAVSRAIGDFEYKRYNTSHLVKNLSNMDSRREFAQTLKVSPFPEVTYQRRYNTDSCLILACDGIWDVMSNSECHNHVISCLEETEMKGLGDIAEDLLDTCLSKGSRDNMSILLCLFPQQKESSNEIKWTKL